MVDSQEQLIANIILKKNQNINHLKIHYPGTKKSLASHIINIKNYIIKNNRQQWICIRECP